jgi:hypothetical protein
MEFALAAMAQQFLPGEETGDPRPDGHLMSELLQQGYRLVSVNEIITNPPIQDVMTTFYLFRDSDLVRCQEGARLLSEKYWVTSCARIAKPYEVKSN